MKRRAFLSALLGLPVAAKLAPAVKPTGGLFNPTANIAAQYEAMSIRHLSVYDTTLEQYVTRIDALYGFGAPAIQVDFSKASLHHD